MAHFPAFGHRHRQRPPARAGAPAGHGRQATSAVAFEEIVCAVDGSLASLEAVRQAVVLCGEGGHLRFVAVCREEGAESEEPAALERERADRLIDEAVESARAGGVAATGSLLSAARVAEALRGAVAGRDLLVLGSHGGTRFGGIVLGPVVTQLAHRCDKPLLIARRSFGHGGFPERVLVASDGSPGSWAAARAAARLAAQHGSELRMVHVAEDGTGAEARHELLRQLMFIEEKTGAVPDLVDRPGAVPERICRSAEDDHSSLIVIGRRGRSGAPGLGQVSEPVAHRSQCSVLLVPG